MDGLEDKVYDECGVFGIFDPSANGQLDVARITYFGLYGLQHRGQESAGIAVSNGKRFTLHRGMGLVRDVFKSEKDLALLGKGVLAIGHNRYSTTGSVHIKNAHPFLLEKDGRQIVICHNGNLINSLELKRQVKNVKLKSTTDSEIVAALLLESEKATWEERFADIFPRVVGAYSFVIATRDLLFGVRDPFGVRPLLLGKLNDGWVLSSEDCIFPGIGAQLIREVEPGETVIIDKNGPESFYRQKVKKEAFCIFEYVYIARPDSTLRGQSVGKAREEAGELLVEEAPIEADMVMAVPDSGMTAAIAFAKKSGIPLGEGVIKNRYIGRTFIQPDPRMRELGVKIKFGPMAANLRDKRVVVVDDSIVRGTTMREFVALLKTYGAKEVHLRIACPPLTDPCFYGVDMPTKEELMANKVGVNPYSKEVVEKVRDFLGATSLAYLSLAGLIEAAGGDPKIDPQDTKFCTACLTGKYKVPLNGAAGKFQLENPEYPSELIEKE